MKASPLIGHVNEIDMSDSAICDALPHGLCALCEALRRGVDFGKFMLRFLKQIIVASENYRATESVILLHMLARLNCTASK